MTRAARLRQADVQRVIRAARLERVSHVEVTMPGGLSMRIPTDGRPLEQIVPAADQIPGKRRGVL